MKNEANQAKLNKTKPSQAKLKPNHPKTKLKFMPRNYKNID